MENTKQIEVKDVKFESSVLGDGINIYAVAITGELTGYPKSKLIAHLEKSLNAFIAKTKKEEVL